jgi:hypothetical protein
MGVSKKEISPCPIDATLSVIDGRWKGHHPMAIVGWPDENERTEKKYPSDHGANASPSPGT